MRFANEIWLWGVLGALLLALVYVVMGLRLRAAKRAFGQEEQVNTLLTARTGTRRAMSAAMICMAVAFAAIAAAAPQYGRGTRVLPATNLDVVLVLDFSKSMYARDVSPSRIERAKVEVSRLVRELGGARFGAVAFAGESISFPLTSDGAAIAQFFKGLEPNDMPLGGTAIARALEAGRQLIDRDPLAKNHERVIILITDGEDLEGDPVEVARSIHQSGTRVEVVQIGGRSPEPIPEMGENGEMRGLRHNASGQILTTSLSPEGEAQLLGIANAAGGEVVHSAAGQVGIDEMTVRLRRLMTEELSERVETVYADVFQYPLSVAILLLMLEVWIGTSKKRVLAPEPPRGASKRRRKPRLQQGAVLLVLLALGCEPADRLFERKSPVVEDAIAALADGRSEDATELLVDYLETGACEEGVIAVGERSRTYADAAYDLALSFSPAKKPGEPDPSDPTVAPAPQNMPSAPPAGPDSASAPPQNSELDCALRLLAPIFADQKLPAALRARALYLAGNLELNRGGFEAAINYYNQAIVLTPGTEENQGDPIGVDVAYNRALALRLLQEKKEQEQQNSDQNEDQKDQGDQGDQSDQDKESEDQDDKSDSEDQKDDQNSDPSQDESEDEQDQDGQNGDQEEEQPKDQDSGDKEDASEEPSDQEKSEDEKSNSQTPPDQKNPGEEGKEQESQASEQARNERMLDLLEQAPTLQQHDAEQRKAKRIHGRMTMEDK